MRIFNFIKNYIPRPYIKIEYCGSWYATTDTVKTEEFGEDETISIVWMTPKKYKKMPEFQGF